MRGWVVLLWAVLATIVLVAVGIFGTLIVSGRIVLFPVRRRPPRRVATVAPVVDTSYWVIVLNATPEQGLATQTEGSVVGAGWAEDAVLASERRRRPTSPRRPIYYDLPRGRGRSAGPRRDGDRRGERRAERRIPAADDPNPEVDESSCTIVVVVLDRTARAPAEPLTPTP